MRSITWLAVLGFAIAAGPALADPWKGKGGKGKWHGGYERHGPYGGTYGPGRKTKYRTADGCVVERKWKKGGLEEKVKCKPGWYGYRY